LEYSVAVTHSKEHLTNQKKESIEMTQHTEVGNESVALLRDETQQFSISTAKAS